MSGEQQFELLQPTTLSAWTRPVLDRSPLLAPGGRGACWELTSAQKLQCPPPIFSNHPDQAGDPALFFAGPPQSVIEHTVPSRRIYALSEATVIGPKAVVSAGGRVFQETYWSEENLNDGVHFQRLRFKMQASPGMATVPLDAVVWRTIATRPRRAESAVLLAQPWSHNWHHWLLDSLPRWTMLAEAPEFTGWPVIVPSQMSPAQADTLRALGIPEDRWRLLTAAALDLQTLLIPEPAGFSPVALQPLRRALRGSPPPHSNDRLYVSRSDAEARRLVNEPEIIESLRTLGFRSITLTGMSFAEQRDTFAQAALIVGPHGAGLTNSLFSPEGATVVELHPRDTANGCFRLTTAAWNQRYAFLSGPVTVAKNRDFAINPAALRTLVESLLDGTG